MGAPRAGARGAAGSMPGPRSHERMKGSLSKRHSTRCEGSFPIGHAPRRSCKTPSRSPGCAGGFVRSSPASRGTVTRRWDYGAGEIKKIKITLAATTPAWRSTLGGKTKETLESLRSCPVNDGLVCCVSAADRPRAFGEGARGGLEGPQGGRVAFRGCCVPPISAPKSQQQARKEKEENLARRENL